MLMFFNEFLRSKVKQGLVKSRAKAQFFLKNINIQFTFISFYF